jgi:biotin transport system ATP-binding protein
LNIIEIKNLKYTFPDGTSGLIDINLTIKKGSFNVVAGRNGSGKTILLRHINGLLKPDSGTVTVKGLNVWKKQNKVRQIAALMFQDADNQIIGETVKKDIAFGPENLGLKKKETENIVNEILKLTDLLEKADSLSHVLSGGEKRRLALAGVLALKPEILMLDEPFSSLDYPGTKTLLHKVAELNKLGITIILVTHDLSKVLAYTDRLVIMDNGRVVRNGMPYKFLNDLEQFGVRKPVIPGRGSLEKRIKEFIW